MTDMLQQAKLMPLGVEGQLSMLSESDWSINSNQRIKV
ncbi:hypothetical protein SLEP1_g19313 [Rubroshorea leprosula]|nr:hypothetical protein SLEP1_g19313 [Rubroshorea leprosula]